MFRPSLRPVSQVTRIPARGYHGHANFSQALNNFVRDKNVEYNASAMRNLNLSMKHALASALLNKCVKNKDIDWTFFEKVGITKLIDEHRVSDLEEPEIYEAYDRRLSEYKRGTKGK